MRITYLANIRLPTEKAHGVQIMKMCEAFVELGHEVTLVVPWRFNAIKGDPFTYYGVAPTFKIQRIFSIDLIWAGKFGFVIQVFTFAVAAAITARFGNADIVYTRDPAVVYTCGKLGVHPVWETHTAAWNFVSSTAVRYAEKIVVISGGLAEFYQRHGASAAKIFAAHDGADLRDFALKETKEELRVRLALPADKKIIAYVGKFKTMGQSKGVEEIIQAAGALAPLHPSSFLLLVGLNADEFTSVQEVVAHASLREGQYKLVGHVPRAQVPAYLKAADVLVMSYPNTEHYARMMSPLKLFEYMASGVSIVSSDLPSVREVLGEGNAVLVEPDSIAALTAGIEELLNDPARAAERAQRASQDVAAYTWKRRAESILETIEIKTGNK